jgi:hypothetical protein
MIKLSKLLLEAPYDEEPSSFPNEQEVIQDYINTLSLEGTTMPDVMEDVKDTNHAFQLRLLIAIAEKGLLNLSNSNIKIPPNGVLQMFNTQSDMAYDALANYNLNENKTDYYIDRRGKQFQVVDANYLQYPGLVKVKYDNGEPVEYKGNFEADLKSGMIERLDEAFFIGEDENSEQEETDVDVECGKCGWQWNTADSDESDKYICHECNYDNSYRYANKANNETIEEYDVENADDIREFIEFIREYQQQLNEADCDCLLEAKYQGRTVPLGKPMRGDSKKFKVYVKNPKTGKVVKVNFGAKGMNIKKNNPVRRKAFRARHNCANPGPRTKARYWSCRKW